MNNNIQRITKGIAEACYECIKVAYEDESAKKEILRGGGNRGGILTRLLMLRPINKIRISKDALNLCIKHNVLAYDFFILTTNQLTKKYKNFFSSNEKTIDKCHSIGHFLTADHNVPNKMLLNKMFELYKANPNKIKASDIRKLLLEQSYDLITLEENKRLNDAGFKSFGTKEERDYLCSYKIEFNDLWLTPKSVINDFFKLSNLDKNQCLDPCASDGRWLDKQGMSIDILPVVDFVKEQDFLTLKKEDVPKHIKYIVGNLPFSLLNEFVNKSLELVDECYFLVNGDTIFKHFPNNIKHIYIFSGLEGNQKDNRSRCEFDVPFLIKSALWCCIVHITKQKQEPWIIEKDIANHIKRDGKHIALGRNTFINCVCDVDSCNRISRIFVNSEIIWKNGKKIIEDGVEIDLRNLINLK